MNTMLMEELMHTKLALEQDVARRIHRVQTIMKEKGVGALFIPAYGAPDMMGMAKYFTNLQLWAGTAWIILGSENPTPAMILMSPYAADWNRQDATTPWVENPDLDALGRAIELTQEFIGKDKKVGIENLASNWKKGDWDRVSSELSDREFIDLTKELNDVRAIKTAFEIEENYNMGCIMAEAFVAFEAAATPGSRVWDAAAASERLLKSEGSFWGRTKFSFDLRPQTIPMPLDKRFNEDDIFVYEIVYTSPLGYWYEASSLYSFKPLPVDLRAQIEAQQKVIMNAANHAKPGFKIGHFHELNRQCWKDQGFKAIGEHTPSCHSIGLDGTDGPSACLTPEEELKANMILSFHPSTLLEGNRAFLISDNYLVTPDGGVRLSPMKAIYKMLDG